MSIFISGYRPFNSGFKGEERKSYLNDDTFNVYECLYFSMLINVDEYDGLSTVFNIYTPPA